MAIQKVIELVGTSEKSWEDAVQQVVKATAESVRHISGVEVLRQRAQIVEGKLTGFQVTVQLAFEVEEQSHIFGAASR